MSDEINLTLDFEDNGLLPDLFGEHNRNLARLEQMLDVTIHERGNQLIVVGDPENVNHTKDVLQSLYQRLKKDMIVGPQEVDGAIRMAIDGQEAPYVKADKKKTKAALPDTAMVIKTRKKHISPRSPLQADYFRSIDSCELVFGVGPAGTGKTYLAVAKAVEALTTGEVDRIILSRPAVEAGEQLGFLPGDMQEKVDPYLRPIYDALYDMLPQDQVEKRMEKGEIEIAPLAFMRGRTLSNAFVILDEAQNTTAVQMKMFLTRLGEGSHMVVTGDLSQVDLPHGVRSGLRDALETLEGVKGIGAIRFTEKDVVRHRLVKRIVDAYDKAEKNREDAEIYEKPRGRRFKK
ncbi:PhoH family protein [Terasakiella sp. SH-1]|uniref:PhoH family protein n=1 Tax=Terasakiella sp. SH-1 TaxID=2560057 RepID=UPI001F1051FF|nr:PhoH family protein [Terasakiella sp. SH-1]